MTIGLIDSGIGGFSILLAAQTALPQQQFVYLADEANFPYSEKSDQELIRLAIKHVHILTEKFHCDILVFACNTLTVAALAATRLEFPHLKIIGTVPPTKVAAITLLPNSPVLILATKHTAESVYLKNLVEKEPGPDWTIVGTTQLVEAIETNNQEKILNILQEIKERYPTPFAGIVLGCTHFSLASSELKAIWPTAKQFSPSKGVVQQLQAYTASQPAVPKSNTLFFLSTPTYEHSKNLEERFAKIQLLGL